MKSTPPQQPVVIQKLKLAFSDWIKIAPHIPKIARYGLGAKIEHSFVSVLDIVHQAVFTSTEKKQLLVEQAITRLDTLSFFLHIAYENRLVPQKEYLILAEKIHEIGRHLGGWRKFIQNKLPTTKTPR
jgi:hypothetical protein